MAIKGTILGDIAGSKYEGSSAKKFGEDPKTVELYTDKNNFTDDTVMALAVKYAVEKGIDYETAMHAIGQMYPFCGYGHNFFAWIFAQKTHPYNSYGNGSAMRVSFIGEHFDDKEDVKREAIAQAKVSHNHPEGLKGAVVTAICIWMARHGYDKEQIYSYMLNEYPPGTYKYSGLSLQELAEKEASDVTCQTSIPVALRCFYESSDYESFIRNVISIECDSDTVAAIGGGIAEEYYKKTFDNADEILEKYLDDDLYELLNGVYVEKSYKIKLLDKEYSRKPYIGLTNTTHLGGVCFVNEKQAEILTKRDIILNNGITSFLENKEFELVRVK